ncbi:hypothetical protein DL769_006086 [Monosporascus sp. CRB-8-3]|nr:hypothetical protein DL769_006086 [Monosporascus sp. CRB-8-3]
MQWNGPIVHAEFQKDDIKRTKNRLAQRRYRNQLRNKEQGANSRGGTKEPENITIRTGKPPEANIQRPESRRSSHTRNRQSVSGSKPGTGGNAEAQPSSKHSALLPDRPANFQDWGFDRQKNSGAVPDSYPSTLGSTSLSDLESSSLVSMSHVNSESLGSLDDWVAQLSNEELASGPDVDFLDPEDESYLVSPATDGTGKGQPGGNPAAYGHEKSDSDSCTCAARRSRQLPWPPKASSWLGDVVVDRVSLEERMGAVLKAAEQAGFDSFDDVATSYYTAAFQRGSEPHVAQSASRSYRLRRFLAELHESSKTWVGREAQGYHEERIDTVERAFKDELERMGRAAERGGGSGEGGGGVADARKRRFIADTIGQLLQDETSDSLWRRDKRYLQLQFAGIWSFLSKIAQQVEVPELELSRAICVFFYMLKTPHKATLCDR